MGASSGLGRQLALCLAEQGANVAICARRVERFEAVKAEVEAYGVKCVVCPCDVSKPEQVRTAVDKAVSELGRVDILINNAGAGFSTPAVEASDEDWDHRVASNRPEQGRPIPHQRDGPPLSFSS